MTILDEVERGYLRMLGGFMRQGNDHMVDIVVDALRQYRNRSWGHLVAAE